MFLRTILMLFFSFLIIIATTAQTTQYLLLYSDVIYFESGSDVVVSKYSKTLDEIAKAIKENTNGTAWIQAHTDSLGSFEDNKILSDKRAKAIYMELAKRQVDSIQLRIDSHGEYIPLSTNGTAQGRSLNRRVTVEVVRPYTPIKKETRQFYITGKTYNAQTQRAVKTKLFFSSLEGKDSLETDENGNYSFAMNIETPVEIRAYAKGYFFMSKMARADRKDTVEVDFLLEPAVLGGKMALNDLFFHGGTPILLASSEKALEGVLSFMKFNDDLKIEIGGHINKPNEPAVTETSSSFILSKERAFSVYNYLIDNGIAKERLSFKGYGNFEMIYPKAETPIQEQMNRRVELKVVE